MAGERQALIEKLRRYLAWQDSPEFDPCPRCHGKGYHHGFGEHGHDPDWCERCGGPGEWPTEPGTWSPDDLLREALAALAPEPTPDPPPAETGQRLREALRDAEAVMSLYIYPKPDVGPKHPWSVLQRVRAALAPSAAERTEGRETWQPIATAPDDAIGYVTPGTLVQVWGPEVGYGQLYGFVARAETAYTHWRHLPAPPVAGEGRDRP